jgi:hypothetical protein
MEPMQIYTGFPFHAVKIKHPKRMKCNEYLKRRKAQSQQDGEPGQN